jgi:hypothetical protein
MGFYFFYLLHPDRSPFLTGAQEPPLVQTRVGGLTRGALATWFVFFFSFFSFSLLNPFPLQAHWNSFVESARAVPFRSRTRGVTPQSAGSSFLFFSSSLTDPLTEGEGFFTTPRPSAHEREGRHRSHLVHHFIFFPFLCRSLTAPLFLTFPSCSSLATRRVASHAVSLALSLPL